jgi:plastocyanin
MRYIKLIQIVCIVILLSAFSPGCLLEPEKSPSQATPGVSVNPTISVTAPVETPLETVRTSSIFKVLIDDYSFYKVTDTTNKELEYKNFTLNIKTGDTVEWRNEADYNDILTLISDQGLWTPGELKAKLMNNKAFNYTFTDPGTYTFRIKEEPRVLPQTIIVKP